MASTAAHRSTGWAVGLIAAVVVSRRIADPYHVWCVLTLVAGYAGGTAPDWLENAWWSRGTGRQLWIAHRTWTHWGLAWIGLLYLCYVNLDRSLLAAPMFGFAAGGLMHLLADWPNPLGVPWLLTQRHSLKWWKSGRCDYLIIGAVWTLAIGYADRAWLHGLLYRHLTAFAAGVIGSVPHSHVESFRYWWRMQ